MVHPFPSDSSARLFDGHGYPRLLAVSARRLVVTSQTAAGVVPAQADERVMTDLDRQLGAILVVAQAVARGDLSQKITVDATGTVGDLRDTINAMVEQLSGFSSEVIRVARELGTEGRLGAQATVPHAEGIWRDLTDSV